MAHKLRYVPVVTRARVKGVLDARIPALIESGVLERHVGVAFDLARSRIMLCGNPEMIIDTRKLLGTRGFVVSRRSNPGQMAVENYW
jgi:ferredoxin--NADP+ reductase